MEYMVMPFRRYADFSGRSGRQEYWMFFLLNIIIYTVVTFAGIGSFVATGFHPGSAPGTAVPWVFIALLLVLVIYVLAAIIPTIAVQVRRFHDQDKSGWFVLLGLIPYLGGVIVLVFMCLEGTRGPNRFGPDPRDPYNADVFG